MGINLETTFNDDSFYETEIKIGMYLLMRMWKICLLVLLSKSIDKQNYLMIILYKPDWDKLSDRLKISIFVTEI